MVTVPARDLLLEALDETVSATSFVPVFDAPESTRIQLALLAVVQAQSLAAAVSIVFSPPPIAGGVAEPALSV